MQLKPETIEKLQEAPLGQFCKLDSHTVGFKILSFLDNHFESFTVQEKKIELPLCNINFIDCLSVLSCYIISTPGFHIGIEPFYLKIRRYETLKSNLYRGANFIYQDKFIGVVHSDDGASLLFPSKLQRIIKPEMVRKSDKNGAS